MNTDKKIRIKVLISQCENLKRAVEKTLDNTMTNEIGRYSSFRIYAEQYNKLADSVSDVLEIERNSFDKLCLENMPSWGDSLWPQQLQIIEAVYILVGNLLSGLEAENSFADDEFLNISNFIRNKLRTVIYKKPDREIEVQNAIENLFVGRDWEKGINYDRECGKFEFSGKEYIPDFIIPKLNLAIEVKLLREGRKSKIIEEVNADITAYSKEYDRQLFVIYDLGVIRDETEFRRDIENSGENIKVIVVKH